MLVNFIVFANCPVKRLEIMRSRINFGVLIGSKDFKSKYKVTSETPITRKIMGFGERFIDAIGFCCFMTTY